MNIILREEENNSTPKKSIPFTIEYGTPKSSIISGRRKSILKLPNTPKQETPKRNIKFSDNVEENNNTPKPKIHQLASINEKTPVKKIHTPSKSKSATKTPKSASKISLIRDGILTPSLADKEIISSRRKSDVQIMRDKLHVSAAPDSLPCRDSEYTNIYSFLEAKVADQSGG